MSTPRSHRRSAAGSVLIPALFMLTLLAAAALIIYLKAQSLAALLTVSLHAKRAELRAFDSLGTDYLAAVPQPHSPARLCFKARGRSGNNEAERTICALSSSTPAHGRDGPVLYDYASIFSELDSCDTLPAPPASRSIYGLQLSPGAAYASRVCTDLPHRALPSLKLNANLAAAAPISPGQLLAVTGYLDARQRISVNAETLIVAGGDLYLYELYTTSSTPLAVSLLSATGSVYLEKVSPNIVLSVSARSGKYLPHGARLSHTGRFPARFNFLLQGLLAAAG